MKWKVLSRAEVTSESSTEETILDILLANRGIKTEKLKQEFLAPKHPSKINLKEIGVKKGEVDKVLKRLKQAKKRGEYIVVFGDYDADGICATAILWETLNAAGFKVLPFIPDRFRQGYGLSVETVDEFSKRSESPTLIITVDNGIVAIEAVDVANKLGIDVVICDHHTVGKTLPLACAIIHTTRVGGAGLAWFLAREIRKAFKISNSKFINDDGLELAALGTVTDILPLLAANRSVVKHGLVQLNKTKRPGLKQMIKESARPVGSIGTYDLGFILGPRINAMGRLKHGIDALRLLCTRDEKRALELAQLLGKTNKERQGIVEKVVAHAGEIARKKKWKGAVIVADESYHEGVIGLAAAALVQEYYRPAIVITIGKETCKASARSIDGFNIIEAIRKFDHLLDGGGGHPMAAGFNIKTKNLKRFISEFEKYSAKKLIKSLLTKRLKVDLEVGFTSLTKELYRKLALLAPTGLANPSPTFVTRSVEIVEAKVVGQAKDHLKLTFGQGDRLFKAIAFGFGKMATKFTEGVKVDVAYSLEENEWNGQTSLELRVKDIV